MIDWCLLVNKLRAHGHRPTSVAKKCGIGYAVIARLSRDEVTEPKHSTGEILLEYAKGVLSDDEMDRVRNS